MGLGAWGLGLGAWGMRKRRKTTTFANASVVKESKKIKIYYNRERISPPLGGMGAKTDRYGLDKR